MPKRLPKEKKTTYTRAMQAHQEVVWNARTFQELDDNARSS